MLFRFEDIVGFIYLWLYTVKLHLSDLTTYFNSVLAGYKDCAVRQYSGRSSDPEEVRQRAMNDPEVQQIMSDPAMRMILEQMQSDPQAVQVKMETEMFICIPSDILLGTSEEPGYHAEDNEAEGRWTYFHELQINTEG